MNNENDNPTYFNSSTDCDDMKKITTNNKENNRTAIMIPDKIVFDPDRYYILIEFVYKHLDFHIAELQSVLQMNGLHIDFTNTNTNTNIVQVIPLPAIPITSTSTTTTAIISESKVGNQPEQISNDSTIIEDTNGSHNDCIDESNESLIEQSRKRQRIDTISNETYHKNSLDTTDRLQRKSDANNDNSTNLPTTTIATTPYRPKKNKGTARRPFLILSFPSDSPYVPDYYPLKKEDHEPNEKATTRKKSSSKHKDIATIILSRCILVRSVIELWGMGTSLETCVQSCQQYINVPTEENTTVNPNRNDTTLLSMGQLLYQTHAKDSTKSWKMTVHTLGSKYTRNEQNDMRYYFAFLNIAGTVQMVNPANEFIIVHEIELDALGSPLYPRRPNHGTKTVTTSDEDGKECNSEGTDDDTPNEQKQQQQQQPLAIYFGRALQCAITETDGLSDANQSPTDFDDDEHKLSTATSSTTTKSHKNSIRQMKRLNGVGIDQYSLKKRKYLGPTSMDAELSFIMVNLGQVKSNHIVFDPFVGTGSILLSAAIHSRGAYVVGTDIDIRVLRGNTTKTDENIVSNFQQYNLPRPELIRSDNSIYHRHYRCDVPFYDAIICDPPYGIRAGARQSGSRKPVVTPILDTNRHDHIAQTKPYPVSDVMADLLDVAARTLVLLGRLVYIIPSFRHNFNPLVDLPQHECLQLLHCCYQPLSIDLGRRMVVMEKVRQYDVTKRDDYRSNVWMNGPESAEKCANIREKLQEAAKLKPNYIEKKEFRTRKRKQLKQERKQQQQQQQQQQKEA